MVLAPGSRIDRYEILEEIGTGGMARVLKVRHVVLGSLHALKVLNAELVANQQIRQRFLAEGRIQASLLHPNIARITDTLVQPGTAGLIVDFIDGQSLDQAIAARRRAPAGDEVRALFGPLLDALGYAHAQGIVHRDIKPSNIVLSHDRSGALRPVILDFGIAKVLEPEGGDGAKGKTRTGARLGTANYMSPEQIRSPGKVDHRADLFSLAATMYEFATLTVPFDADSDFDVMANIVSGKLAPPRDLNSTLDPQVAECIAMGLAPDPERRFASADAFSRALLSNHVSSQPTAAPELPRVVALWRRFTKGAGAQPTASVPGRAPDVTPASPKTITSATLDEVLCVIPAGTFVMGSPESEAGRSTDEAQRQVTITRPFAMLRTPVTRAMWRHLTGRDPCTADHPDSAPVVDVSWFDAVAFCNRLSERDGLEPAYGTTEYSLRLDTHGYRLPTEAEWERAARAGTTTAYWSGTSEADLDRAGWYVQNSGSTVHSVAKKAANPWGLYDVHGNVWEWVYDWNGANSEPTASDPLGPSTGSRRTLRGGSWREGAVVARAAYRGTAVPSARYDILGFRVARSID